MAICYPRDCDVRKSLYYQESEKLQNNCRRLQEISALADIPGHSGFRGNEMADLEARRVARDIAIENIKAPAVISLGDVYKIATDILMRSWQRK